MARRGGDLACLMVAYFIGEGVLVMLFLASEYSRTRLEGCTVTPYLQLNGLILIAICFFYGLFSALIFDFEKLIEAELSPGAPAHSAVELSLLLGAVTVIFSVIYTFYLRSCTNSLGWFGGIFLAIMMIAHLSIAAICGILLFLFRQQSRNRAYQSAANKQTDAVLAEVHRWTNTPQERQRYDAFVRRTNVRKDFNPVDEYFFRKYLVYSTSRQLLDVVIEQGHSCPVCLTNFELNDLIIHAECKDLFHWECLRRHLILNTGCPRQTCLHKTAFLSELRNKVISTTRKDEIGLALDLSIKLYIPPPTLDPWLPANPRRFQSIPAPNFADPAINRRRLDRFNHRDGHFFRPIETVEEYHYHF